MIKFLNKWKWSSWLQRSVAEISVWISGVICQKQGNFFGYFETIIINFCNIYVQCTSLGNNHLKHSYEIVASRLVKKDFLSHYFRTSKVACIKQSNISWTVYLGMSGECKKLGFPHLFAGLIFFEFGILPGFAFYFAKSNCGTVLFSLISVTMVWETYVAGKVIQMVLYNSRSWKSARVGNKCYVL